MKPAVAFFGFVLACLAVGAIGGWATASSVSTWFPTLAKPSFNPPSWVFGPVWTTLYIMMGTAAYLAWRAGASLTLFWVQLGLNLGWSLLFFGLRRPDLAFFEILLLWGFILATLVGFWRVNRTAGYLLVPYLAWVSFASVLNFAIWRLN